MPKAAWGQGGGVCPGQAPTHRASRAAGSGLSPTLPPHPPVPSVSPQNLPPWVPISPAIHPKGLPPPTKHPPLWWAQGPGQAFLPSPLPGPLLTPRAIWLMVRTVRQGGSEPLGTQMGGGKGRGRGSGHVPSAQLFPLPLPNKGNSGPRLGGGGLVLREAGKRRTVRMATGRRWGWGSPAPPLPSPSGQG